MDELGRAEAEFRALGKALMLCIAACRCPRCGAEAGVRCRSVAGAVVASHVGRIKAGHTLLATPVAVSFERFFKAQAGR